MLQGYGLYEYFLAPQISWEPKSLSMNRISSSLNISRGSLVFIDDSAFERAEIEMACPDVRTIDAQEYLELPYREEFRVLVTDESRNRRAMYRQQLVRTENQAQYDGEYETFCVNQKFEFRFVPCRPTMCNGSMN